MDVKSLAAMLDQTLLKPTAGFAQGEAWIDSNADLGFASLCVSPFLVPSAARRLTNAATSVCSVASFPLGYASTEAKATEAADLVRLGCQEVDMVVNIAALMEGESEYVRGDIEAVVSAVEEESAGLGLVKVILETGYLTADDIRRGCALAAEAGARFVKTSTGFGPRGASVEDITVMREAVGPDIGIKAAGGIRTLDAALELISAGANRIGTSAGAELLDALAGQGR
jgi:deoxyribose-phosphate aldolase